jgi:hypothetical protein
LPTAKEIIHEKYCNVTIDQIKSLFEIVDGFVEGRRVSEIVDFVYGLLGILSLPVAQHYFFRARKWSKREFPARIDELLEPPSRFTSVGRCNRENNPVLYVSLNPIALISECRLKIGDILALAQFDRDLRTEDLNCIFFGIDPTQRFEGTPEIESILNFRQNCFGEHFNKYLQLEYELHKQFVKVENGTSSVYRFTSTLCERYFKNLEIDAIVYPSVATSGAYTNLAVRAGRYAKTYKMTKVGLFEVTAREDMRQLAGSVVEPSGELDWSKTVRFDQPLGVGIYNIDPCDPRIYIAPWKSKA